MPNLFKHYSKQHYVLISHCMTTPNNLAAQFRPFVYRQPIYRLKLPWTTIYIPYQTEDSALQYHTYRTSRALWSIITNGSRIVEWRQARGKISNWGHIDFNFQCMSGYQINFQLVLNTAYSCLSGIDCMHWSLKQSQIQYQHQKMQAKDYSEYEHKHYTMQPSDTAFGATGRQTFEWETRPQRQRHLEPLLKLIAFCSVGRFLFTRFC